MANIAEKSREKKDEREWERNGKIGIEFNNMICVCGCMMLLFKKIAQNIHINRNLCIYDDKYISILNQAKQYTWAWIKHNQANYAYAYAYAYVWWTGRKSHENGWSNE